MPGFTGAKPRAKGNGAGRTPTNMDNKGAPSDSVIAAADRRLGLHGRRPWTSGCGYGDQTQSYLAKETRSPVTGVVPFSPRLLEKPPSRAAKGRRRSTVRVGGGPTPPPS